MDFFKVSIKNVDYPNKEYNEWYFKSAKKAKDKIFIEIERLKGIWRTTLYNHWEISVGDSLYSIYLENLYFED